MKMVVGFILGTEERRKSLKNTRTYWISSRVRYEAGSLETLEMSKAPLEDLCQPQTEIPRSSLWVWDSGNQRQMWCWFWPREISMAVWEVGSKKTTLMAAADPLLVWNPRQLVRGQATNTDLGHTTACWPAVAATTSPSIHPPHHCRCELSETEDLSGQMFRWLSTTYTRMSKGFIALWLAGTSCPHALQLLSTWCRSNSGRHHSPLLTLLESSFTTHSCTLFSNLLTHFQFLEHICCLSFLSLSYPIPPAWIPSLN